MTLKTSVSKIFSTRNIILVVALVLLFLGGKFLIDKIEGLNVELAIANQNQVSLKDSLRVNKNKVKDLVFSKQILIAEHEADVKRLNKQLFDDAKKFKGKIHQLTTIIANIKSDTIVIDNTEVVQYPNGDKGITFEFAEVYDSVNSRFIEGLTRFQYDTINNNIIPLKTLITKDIINFQISQGLRTKDGKIEMFASSTYPNFQVSELNSVIIDPKTHPVLKKFTKKKKLTLSLYCGYGATLNTKTNIVIVGPQVGGGVGYTIW